MLRTARLLILGLLAAAPPAFGQSGSPTVVVLTFENGGSYGLDSLDFAGLGRAISATLTVQPLPERRHPHRLACGSAGGR